MSKEEVKDVETTEEVKDVETKENDKKEVKVDDKANSTANKVIIPFLMIFAVGCMLFFGQTMANGNFGKLIKTFGVAASTIGLVASSYSYTAIAMRFVAGPMMDSFSRKKILMIGLALYCAAFLGYSVGATMNNLVVVIVMRIFQGFGMSICSAASMALASDLVPNKGMGTGLGMFSMTNSLASAFAPGIGLFLAETFGYPVMYLTAALMCALGFIICIFVKEPDREFRPFKVKKFSDIFAIECMLSLVIKFLLQCVYYNQTTYLMIYAEEVNAALVISIGVYFTVHNGICFFTRPLFGSLTDKFGTIPILFMGMASMMVCFWTISFSTELWQFLIAAVFGGCGYQPCKTVLQTLAVKQAGGKDRRGVAVSASYLSQDAGNLVGPIVAGFVVDAVGYRLMWRLSTILIVAAAIVVIIWRKPILEADAKFKGVDLGGKKKK